MRKSRALLCSAVKHNCARPDHYDASMRSELASTLAENVKRLMDRDGLSQRELAKRARISQSGVGFVLRYEDVGDRHASLDTVEALAKAFGVSALNLLRPGFGAAAAQNVHSITERIASGEGARRPEEPRSTGEVDVELMQFIFEQAATLRGWSAAERGAAAAYVYNQVVKEEKRPTKATVLRLLRTTA